jgi:hypothetical protein
MLSFSIGLILLITFVWGFDVYAHRRPLEDNELLRLAQKRQRNQALIAYRFSRLRFQADLSVKKMMKSEGEFVSCDLDYYHLPAKISALLKYKKHEWIVIAFISQKRAYRLWWNKGPDGKTVWSFLHHHSLRSTIEVLKPDMIAIFHNHPNPDPSRYRMTSPSQADLRSAGLYDKEFGQCGVSLLEFICERGSPHLYYAGFVDRTIPMQTVIREIRQANGKGIFKNYFLRKELKRKTLAEQVPGQNTLYSDSRSADIT